MEEPILKETVYVAAIVHGEENCSFYRKIARSLAACGMRAHFSFSKSSISSHLGRANKLKAAFALIIGEEEWQRGEVSVKKMDTGVQKRVKLDELADGFKSF
ncbi:MAG: hypothetical protein HY585_02065 [Candidatus Omnitrophica bacterium]|nr:hypothetical protein [Candidatus Omnitrophota bacterium]